MRYGRFLLQCEMFMVATAMTCPAQTTGSQATTTALQQSTRSMSDQELAVAVANSLGPAGIVPRTTGFNASVITSSQYDSITGWANVLTPSLAWRFNRYISVDVATPIFMYMRSQRDAAPPGGGPAYLDTTIRHGLPGDTTMAAHISSKGFTMGRLGDFYNVVTGSLSAPTGSVEDGIGAGKVTYNITNHLQSASVLAPYVDLGIGSTSRLQNRRVQRSQTSRGQLANFGVGVSMLLPRNSTVYLEGYEQLPLGNQTVYQVDPRTGRPTATQDRNGLAEDNGINLSLDIPVAPHLTWSAFYSRGLRLHEDTAGFALTFILRNPLKRKPDR